MNTVCPAFLKKVNKGESSGPCHAPGAQEEQGQSLRASGGDTLTLDMFIEELLQSLQEVTVFVGDDSRAVSLARMVICDLIGQECRTWSGAQARLVRSSRCAGAHC